MATAAAALSAVGGAGRVAEADAGLIQVAEWRPFPGDTSGHGHLALDPGAGVGYAFSGTAVDGLSWERVQAVDLATGKHVGKSVALPVTIDSRVPLYVDPQRHAVIWADSYSTSLASPPAPQRLHGIGLRNGVVKHLFTVDAPTGSLRIAGFAPDERNEDLVVVATADGTSQQLLSGLSLIEVTRLPLDDLVAGRAKPRWASNVRFPLGSCNSLVQNVLPTAVLPVDDKLYVACRGAGTAFTGQVPQLATGGASGVVELTGVGRTASPNVTTRAFRTAGNFTLAGAESIADPKMRRILMVETGGYNGFRVFDTDHRRFVGRINGGALQMNGFVVARDSSRVYFISGDKDVGLAYGDDAALIPTQGERLPVPFAALFAQGTTRRLSFDERTRRLFVPLRRKDEAGRLVESVLVLKDVADPYVAPEKPDYAAGTIDAADVEGKTDSEQAATARAFGADYQLVGGTANLLQNVTSVDTRGQARPGTRYLRQAYVRSANLTGDGARAEATVAEEDATTDQDRYDNDLGREFAPVATCTDFGAGKTSDAKLGATVTCDLGGMTVTGSARYDAASGVFVTGPGQANPVPAPVQMGDAYSEVKEQRGVGRGALVTTVRAVAENVTIGGVVKLGRVEQVATLTSHGRTGTAKIDRKVTISEVSVNGSPLCGAACSIASVRDTLNKTFDGRFWVDFPAAYEVADKRGTYAEVAQDPYWHAERKLDYDKPEEDFVVPAMSVVSLLDGVSKTRLVTEFAAVSGTASYRTFPRSDFDYDDDEDGTDETAAPTPGPVATLTPGGGPAPTTGPAPKPSPTTVAGGSGGQDDGAVGAILDRLRLSLRSLGDAFPLLLIWALLGVPAYLSARRRLLLELPMLTRDEDLS